MPSPSMADEVAFISGVNADGTLPLYAYSAWNSDTPATYTGGYTNTAKWGTATAGTPGGTVYYYFDPASNWTTTESSWLAAGLALWSAVANISFAPTTNATQAQITFTRGTAGKAETSYKVSYGAGAALTGGSVLATFNSVTITLDTSVAGFGPIDGNFSTYGGYPLMTLLHEEGHALGLGHAGPYNDTADPVSQQYSAYDTRLWSVMSYINPAKATAQYYAQYPVTGTYWGYSNGYGNVPTTWMPLDVLAVQALYGAPASTPLSGGQVFGFHSNLSGAIKPYFDFTQNTTPIVTIWDKGPNNTLDLSGFTTPDTVSLKPGTFSSVDGLTNNIAIAFGTAVDTLVCGGGNTTVTCNDDGDTIYASAGNDTITGGAGVDTFYIGTGTDRIDGGSNVNTVVLSGPKSAYQINQTSTGTFVVTGTGVNDTLTNVEYVQFSDQKYHLLPGVGTAIDWSSNPSNYMAAIRDFDGNDLGGASGWKLIGTAVVNTTGTTEHIYVNSQIGRWAEVGTEADGLTYFSDYGWAGDTRVVGIYIDPLVANGTVVKGSDFDSQRRFQNDLMIGNIHGILGYGDYNHDGLEEVYFSLTDGTAYLHAYMHADGNIQYANYQSQQQVIDYLTSNGWSSNTWAGWFPSAQTAPLAAASTANSSPSLGGSSSILSAVTGA
jgi:serralysin